MEKRPSSPPEAPVRWAVTPRRSALSLAGLTAIFALWGIVQEGWREPWGADADHLKTTGDIDLCLAAG